MNPSRMLPTYSFIPVIAGVLLLLPPAARAEFYKYKDSSGSMVITNKLEDVPKQYRKRVKVVWDDDLEAKDPLARRRAAGESSREQQRVPQQDRQKPVGIKDPTDGKILVISIDEQTGEVIRRFE